MAGVAAPFVHRKPTKDRPPILASRKHVALMKAVRKGKPLSRAEPTQSGEARHPHGRGGRRGGGFAFAVSHGRDERPRHQDRATHPGRPKGGAVLHPKQKQDRKADRTEAELVHALGDEFMVDPKLAAKIRDDELRLRELRYCLDSRSTYGPHTPAQSRRKPHLRHASRKPRSPSGVRQDIGRRSRLPTLCSQIVWLLNAPW